MKLERESFDELDALIDGALREEPGRAVPAGFTDLFIRRVKKRMMWHELLTDFSFKMALVLGVLALFTGIYFLVIPRDSNMILSYLSRSWQAVIAVSVVLVFTFFTDQVFLKYFFRRSR
jgi:hypothetical protein